MIIAMFFWHQLMVLWNWEKSKNADALPLYMYQSCCSYHLNSLVSSADRIHEILSLSSDWLWIRHRILGLSKRKMDLPWFTKILTMSIFAIRTSSSALSSHPQVSQTRNDGSVLVFPVFETGRMVERSGWWWASNDAVHLCLWAAIWWKIHGSANASVELGFKETVWQ